MKVVVSKGCCKEYGLYIYHCPRKTINKCDILNVNGYYLVQVGDETYTACGICYITYPDGVFRVSGEIEGEVR